MKFLIAPIFWIICLLIIFFLLIHILTKSKRGNIDDVIARASTLPI